MGGHLTLMVLLCLLFQHAFIGFTSESKDPVPTQSWWNTNTNNDESSHVGSKDSGDKIKPTKIPNSESSVVKNSGEKSKDSSDSKSTKNPISQSKDSGDSKDNSS